MSPLARDLSRRERQILEALHRQGPSTVAEVLAAIPDPPGYSAVRALLRTMESKGHVRHREDGPRYVYEPATATGDERVSAIRHVVQTYFDGSTQDAVAALLGSDARLDRERLADILQMIDRAHKEGR
jgi:predicted transcriptional regulator